MDTLEVIERFVDRERVDADALKGALATEEGLSYLLDLLAIRELVVDQGDAATPVAPSPPVRRRRGPRLLVAVAAGAVLAISSYQWGVRNASMSVPRADILTPVLSRAVPLPLDAAPAPTSVIHLEPGVDWHQVGTN